MNIKTIITIALLMVVNLSLAQEFLSLTKTEAIEDFQVLRNALEYVHPRLYKYSDKQSLDAGFKILENSIADNISGLDFLGLVSKANASVNCGHLYTIPQGKIKEEVLNKKVLPFYFKIIENDIFVLNNCSNIEDVSAGSKIISINDIKSSDILEMMFKGIATDGYIETRKRRLSERYFFYGFHGFDFNYHLHVDRNTIFKVVYQTIGSEELKSVEVQGVSINDRRQRLKDKFGIDEGSWFNQPSPRFELFEKGNYGVLHINRSFFDKEIDPDYDAVLDKSFKMLKHKSIKNLIIDLRDNEGGSEHHQKELMSYLYDKPFKLYQNIYLSNLDFRPLKNVIIERDTSDLIFNNDDGYMRKFSNNLWINNYEYSDNLTLQKPKENVFEGQVYVLINGITFSSAADLASDIRKTTDAIFLGEERGGTFEGPTGGGNIVIQLPNSQIMVRISPNIQVSYMYKKHPYGRGVLPDHEILYSIRDVISEEDLEMKKAIKLIKESN